MRSSRCEPFILHNVDVLSSIDLGAMVKFHREHEALATLAMRQRESSRQLLFDEHLQLCGRRVEEAAEAGDGSSRMGDASVGIFRYSRHLAAHFFLDE